MSDQKGHKKITIEHITKIEGHATLDLKIEKGKVIICKLGSTEGARFFESIIVGKKYDEAYEICSRICGICSCGHTVCGLRALEKALDVKVTKQTELLRELITIGERIRSHLSHLYFFVLPDYLGFESALAMVPKYRKEVTTALGINHIGNELVATVGGRDMHPFASIPGGFTQIPKDEDLKKIAKKFKGQRKEIKGIIQFFGKLKYPNYTHEGQYVCIKQSGEFSLHDGNLVSNKGLNLEPSRYKEHLEEYIVTHSSAKFAVMEGKEYMTGALSRINLNYKELNPSVKKLIKESGIKFPSHNPFHQNFAQALEVLHWVDQAISIIDKNTFVHEDPVKFKPKAGHGVAAIEVPRGILFHDYKLDDEGKVTEANIITPTVQNLANVNIEIRGFVDKLLARKKKLSKAELVSNIEMLIRAYDPCFSCSTHFLKVNWV